MYHSPTNSTHKAICKTKKERKENVVEMNPTLLKQQASERLALGSGYTCLKTNGTEAKASTVYSTLFSFLFTVFNN